MHKRLKIYRTITQWIVSVYVKNIDFFPRCVHCTLSSMKRMWIAYEKKRIQISLLHFALLHCRPEILGHSHWNVQVRSENENMETKTWEDSRLVKWNKIVLNMLTMTSFVCIEEHKKLRLTQVKDSFFTSTLLNSQNVSESNFKMSFHFSCCIIYITKTKKKVWKKKIREIRRVNCVTFNSRRWRRLKIHFSVPFSTREIQISFKRIQFCRIKRKRARGNE